MQGRQLSEAEPPPLVRQAQALAARLAFQRSCSDATGRLLHILAGQCRHGAIGETGTGCGVGAGDPGSALAPRASLVSVEIDPERAAAASGLLASQPTVRVLHANWDAILAYGPFELLFIDGGAAVKGSPDGSRGVDARDADRVLAALRPGGLLVLDDLTPESSWPRAWRGRPDPTRSFWLQDQRLLATEIMVDPAGGPSSAVILARRRL